MKAVYAIVLLVVLAAPAYPEFGIKLQYGQTMEQAHEVECLLKYRFNLGPFQNIIYGGWNTWFFFDYNEFSGHPSYDIYTVGNTIKYKSFYLDVRHFCSHQFSSRYPTYNYMTMGGATKLSAGFELWF